MKKNLRYWALAAMGAAAAFAFSSCAYDPYYGAAGGYYGSGSGYYGSGGGYYGSGGGYYGSAYGDGYGYGSRNFSTSLFVATGDPRWGYDPYCYSYYDYQRHSYYDPYLNGYYPVGYRPAVVFGVPHPYGWRPGRGYISPPRHVNYGMASNYRNRDSAYRSSNYGWAHQVRTQPAYAGQTSSQYGTRNSYSRSNLATRPSSHGGNYGSNYGSNYARSSAPAHSATYGGNYARSSAPSRPATGNYAVQGQQRSVYSQGRTPTYNSGQNYSRSSAGSSRPAAGSSQRQFQQAPRQSQQPAAPRSVQHGNSSAPSNPRVHGGGGSNSRRDSGSSH